LLVVTKQYLVLAALPFLRVLLSARQKSGLAVASGVVAASAVTLPFALWHPRSFVRTVLLLQTEEPFRIDSLSYLSWAARAGLGAGSLFWSIGAAALSLAFVLWRMPKTAAGFAGALGLALFTTFAFGSKAFCNYYFLVVAVLCATVAALPPDE